MDSDAKELGHVRVARSKDRFGLPGLECDHAFLRWQQCSQSKIAHDSRVNSRSRYIDPHLGSGVPTNPDPLPRGRSGGRLQQSTKTPKHRASDTPAVHDHAHVDIRSLLSFILDVNYALGIIDRQKRLWEPRTILAFGDFCLG